MCLSHYNQSNLVVGFKVVWEMELLYLKLSQWLVLRRLSGSVEDQSCNCTCEIWSSCNAVAENSRHLECDTLSLGEEFPMFWRIVVPHVQGQAVQDPKMNVWCVCETSGSTVPYPRRPESPETSLWESQSWPINYKVIQHWWQTNDSVWSNGGMMLMGENQSTRRKDCCSTTLSARNPTWIHRMFQGVCQTGHRWQNSTAQGLCTPDN